MIRMLRAHYKFATGVFALLALLLMSGCGGAAQSPTAQSSALQKTFVSAELWDVIPTGWDPSIEYSNEISVMANIYEGLTRYDSSTRTVQPLLAQSWTSAKNGTVWTFKLRSGATFHTGRVVTAEAAKAALERTIKLGQGAAYIWAAVKTIQAPDAQTLVFRLKYPAPIDLIASAGYSSWIYDTTAAGGGALTKWFNSGQDAGTGPYTIDTYRPGQQVVVALKAYPQYWGGWSGAHYQRVEFLYVPTATTTAQLLSAGQVSYALRVTPQLFASLKKDSSLQAVSTPSFENVFAMLNTKRPPLNDPRVRQAIAYGINYDTLVAVLQGSVQMTSGIIPPGLLGHSENLPNYTYDPAKAKQLLAQAGYGPGGKPINLDLTYITGDDVEADTAAVMKSSLAPLNIRVTPQPEQWSILWARTRTSDLSKRQDIALYEWYPDYPDPYSWFANLFTTQNPPYYNATYYSNPKLDAMISHATKLTGYDKAGAAQLYEEIQTILLHDAPAIVLPTLVYQRVLAKSVGGFVENPAYPNVVFVYSLTPKS
jgi:peptide/nickel transport system substrate-binding protein